MALRFEINGTNYEDPQFWDRLDIEYVYEEKQFSQRYAFRVVFYGSAYDYLYQEWINNPCSEIPIKVYISRLYGDESLLIDGVTIISEAEIDEDKRGISIKIRDNAGERIIEDNQNEEFCVKPSFINSTVFEIQTGQEYVQFLTGNSITYEKRRFYKVFDVLNELMSEMSGGRYSVVSDFFTTNFTSARTVFQIPQGSAGDSILITFTTTLGDDYEISLVHTGNKNQVGNLIRNTLLFTGDDIISNGNEIAKRISQVDFSNNEITIHSEFDIENFTFLLKGNDVTDVEYNPMSYGMGNLRMSERGMLDNQGRFETCPSWIELLQGLDYLFDLSTKWEGNQLRIEPSSYFYDEKEPTSSSINNPKGIFKAYAEIYSDIAIGESCEVSNYTKTQEEWTWEPISVNAFRASVGTDYEIDTGGSEIIVLENDNTGDNYDPSDAWDGLKYVANIKHTGRASGSLIIQQGTQPFLSSIDLLIEVNDELIETITISPDVLSGQSTYNFQSSALCLYDEDVLTFRTSGFSGSEPVLTMKSGSYIQYDVSICVDEPEVRDDDWTNFPDLVIDDFKDCAKRGNRQLGCNFYAGMGYKIAQHMKGIEEYDDMFFLVLFNESQGEPIKFWRDSFFYSETCDCRTEDIESVALYNMPLQRPWIVHNHRYMTPSPVQIVKYAFRHSYSESNGYSYNNTSNIETLPAFGNYRFTQSFEYPVIYEDFLKIVNELYIKGSFGGATKGRLKRINWNVASQKAQFELFTES